MIGYMPKHLMKEVAYFSFYGNLISVLVLFDDHAVTVLRLRVPAQCNFDAEHLFFSYLPDKLFWKLTCSPHSDKQKAVAVLCSHRQCLKHTAVVRMFHETSWRFPNCTEPCHEKFFTLRERVP
jgi:hypothetical protein